MTALMKHYSQQLYGFTFLCVTVLLDQWSKYTIMAFAETGKLPTSFASFFDITLVWNTGISFGMFQHLDHGHIILAALASSLVVALLFWLMRIRGHYEASALGLIIGGAIGNIYDRIQYGAVIDFLDFHVLQFHWPAFNIADSAICIGVAMLILMYFTQKDEVHHD